MDAGLYLCVQRAPTALCRRTRPGPSSPAAAPRTTSLRLTYPPAICYCRAGALKGVVMLPLLLAVHLLAAVLLNLYYAIPAVDYAYAAVRL